ncbi:MAG: response regulator [Oscillospiraceae bacterium]|nr:response regulator [Oscillospiraceae bacterium]MCL2279726.1 response regulator [Oscillospiraceae bacterium]
MPGLSRSLKLNQRLMILMALFVVVAVFMMYLFLRAAISDVIYDNILDNIYQHRTHQATQLDELFIQHSIIVESLSNVLPYVSMDYYQDIIERAAYDLSYTKSFWVALEDGSFFSSTRWVPPDWFVNTERPWWLLAESQSGEVAITLPYVSVETGRITATVSRHIRNWSGQGGVAASNLDLDLIEKKLVDFVRDEEGEFILLGSGGEVIFHPNRVFMPTEHGFHYLFNVEPYSEVKQRLEDGENIIRFVNERGISSYFIVLPLESVDWLFAVIIPTTIASIPLQQTLMTQVFSTIIIIILFAVVLFAYLRSRIIKPIEVLTSGIKEISTNPSDVRIDRLTVDDRAMNRSDEVGALANSIDLMLHKVKTSQELERLMTAKEKSSLILETTPWAVILYDNELNPIDCNNQALELFNYSDKESFLPDIYARAADEQINGENGDVYTKNHLQKALRDGYAQLSEFPLSREDGSVDMLELTFIRVRYGASFALLQYISDITEKIEAEKRESEALHSQRVMYDSIPIPASLWNERIEIIDCNQAMLDFLQTPNKEDVLSRFFEFSPEYQACGARSKDKAKTVLRSMLTEDDISGVHWIYFIDGKIIPAEIVGTRFMMNDEYVCAVYVLDMRHMENTLRLERELAREQERIKQDRKHSERIQAMIDATPLAIEIWDTNFTVVDCNKTTAEMYGYSGKNEFIENFQKHKLRYGDTVDIFFKNIEEAFSKGSNKFEFEDIDLHGNPMQVEVDAEYLLLNNEPVIISYTKNVTELRKATAEMQRLEVVEESNRAKSRFLARMSHEIRTPISAVLGISEIELQDSSLSVRMRESLAKIHNAAGRLLNIVNDLLDLSKIESGRMELFAEEYDVASMISDVTQMHPEYYTNDKIEFKLDVDSNTPALLIGDMLRIKQILTNLLSNAFKYTASGSVEMKVRCIEHDTDYELVLLEVRLNDTGHGMTKEQIDSLKSNEYVRFHESEHREVSGTGLGMPVVFSLLSLMNAKIDIDSEVDVGTKLVISIPQKLAAVTEVIGEEAALGLHNFEAAELLESKKFSFTPEPMPYGSVLVVDDVEANIYVAKGLLAFYGLKVETCSSGYEALDLIKRQGKVYDLVFMDHMMKDLNGIETMKIMREMGYKNPIVALTANAMIGQAQEFLKVGFDGFVSKPIQPKILNATLLEHIRDKKPPEVVSKARRESNWSEGQNVCEFQNSDELTKELRRDFVKRHTGTYFNLCRMIESEDMESAHILAHSLKGVAGLIKLTTLAGIALRIENILEKGEVPNKALLFELGNELDRVIMHIGETSNDDEVSKDVDALGKDESLALLSELQPLLESQNADCLDLLDELMKIPGADELHELVSALDFVGALDILRKMKESL